MTFPLRIGVQIQQQHAPDYAKIRDTVAFAENEGVDIIFNWDHFYPLYGDPDGSHFGDGWTLLAAWAEQTSRVDLGVLVSCVGYRNPDLLADMARTVDHISGGRLIFGVGAGWFEKDYDEYGYEFGTAGSRLALFSEYLDRIQHRVSVLNPPPLGPMPLLIGGSGERKTLREVAKHANIWHSFLPLEEFIRKSEVLAEHGESLGRDTSQIERSTNWPGSGSTVIRALSAQEAPGMADKFLEAGASLFTVGVGGPVYDFTVVREALRWRDSHQ